MPKIRLAYGRFMQESNAFSTVLTRREDFERNHFMAGHELAQACLPQNWEVPGFLKNLELSGFIQAMHKWGKNQVETIPLLSAWTISGGPLERSFFEEVCQDFCQRLLAVGPLDGVYLALHGAMGVEGIDDPEAYLLKQIRQVIGEVSIAVSFDLHANLTRAKVAEIDLLCAYQTNPHYDMARAGRQAGKLLLQTVQGEIQPSMAWRSLPLLLGGGNTLSFLPPMRRIFQRMKRMEADPRVLAVNLLMCHPYLSHPELGWAVQVFTDGEAELAEALAEELAEACWQVRHQQPPEFLDVDSMLKAVRKAKIARSLGSVAVCDTSDVVGAGGTGENTHLLKALLEQASDLNSLYPLRDPVAVEQVWARQAGEVIELSVGGRLQPEVNPALDVSGKLLLCRQTDNFGKVAVLDLGSVKLVLTEGYAMPMKPDFYEDLGLSTRQADIVVTKNFFHFRLYYLGVSRRNLYVKTQGITDFDRLLQVDLPYPAYPRDEISDWRAVDAQKRGLPHPEPAPQTPVKLPESPRSRATKLGLLTFVLLLGGHLLYHRGLIPRSWKQGSK